MPIADGQMSLRASLKPWLTPLFAFFCFLLSVCTGESDTVSWVCTGEYHQKPGFLNSERCVARFMDFATIHFQGTLFWRLPFGPHPASSAPPHLRSRAPPAPPRPRSGSWRAVGEGSSARSGWWWSTRRATPRWVKPLVSGKDDSTCGPISGQLTWLIR